MVPERKEATTVKGKRETLLKQRQENTDAMQRMDTAITAMREAPTEISEWEEPVIRQLVDTVMVLSKDRIEVHLRGGVTITQNISK